MAKRKVFTVALWLLMITLVASQSAYSAIIFSDDFDSYTPGLYPPSPWTNMFSGRSGVVTTEQSHSGEQSFRSESYPNWARWDYVQLTTVPDKLIYKAAVFLNSPGRGGAVGFGFVQPFVSNTGRWANAIHFANTGNVYFSTRTAGASLLGNWTAGVWYELEVRIDYLSLVADVYLNGILVGDGVSTDPQVIPASVYGAPVPLNQFGVFGDNFGGSGTSVIYYDDLVVMEGADPVFLDIKPRSCPNPFSMKWLENIDQGNGKGKIKKGGVLPVAIVGTASFDVTEVDVSTLLIEGVQPLRNSYEDVATPVTGDNDECACTTEGPDGILDLCLKFSRREIAAVMGPLEKNDVVELTLTGILLDGSTFEASDCVIIVGSRVELPAFEPCYEVVLNPAVPNPFNPITRISYYLPREEFVKLSVYDVTGKRVDNLVERVQSAGEYVVEWNASQHASGIYFYRIEVGNFTETRKLILLK